jgi:hypothetical protein
LRKFVFRFSQQRLVDLRLGLEEALLLDWFDRFSRSGYQHCLIFDGEPYFWVATSKVQEDLPLIGSSDWAIRKRLHALCGERDGDIPEAFPLKRREVFTQFGKRMYYAYRPAYELLVGEDDMSLLAEEGITEPPKTPTNPKRKRLPAPVMEILSTLKRFTLEGKPLFTTRIPEDPEHYSKTIGQFSRKLMAIHSGQFFRYYRMPGGSIDEASRARVQAACGSWTAVTALFVEAAKEYRRMFLPEYQPEGSKEHLPRSLEKWLYDDFNQRSSFITALAGAKKVEEGDVDDMMSSLSDEIVDLAVRLYRDSFREVYFWSRITGVIDWYDDNRADLEAADPNAR